MQGYYVNKLQDFFLNLETRNDPLVLQFYKGFKIEKK